MKMRNAVLKKYFRDLADVARRGDARAEVKVFGAMAGLGKRLTDLHLLVSEALDSPFGRFQGEGDNRVAENKNQGFLYEAGGQRVRINKTQYFEPVRQELWEYRIGGYQVLEKWLKDRRTRRLTLEEIKTNCRMACSLQRTMEIQEEIDRLYTDIDTKPLKF